MLDAGNTDLLTARDLKKYYPLKGSILSRSKDVQKSVDGVNLSVKEGEIIGLVGESGCGKSTLARLLIGLEKPTEGDVTFRSRSLIGLNFSDSKEVRKEMQIIFQDPLSSLNPRHRISNIISEPFNIHLSLSKAEKKDRVEELLKMVGLDLGIVSKYPRELSGGQRQRVCIARALTLRPSLIIADEPVSSLDVSIQAKIINLLIDLQDQFDLSLFFISHDLRLVEQISDRVNVMYRGKIVEEASIQELATHPLHPYTMELYESTPALNSDNGIKLESFEGVVEIGEKNSGCVYNSRCPKAIDICYRREPELGINRRGHGVACFLYE